LKETKVFYEELYKFRERNGCKVSDLERAVFELLIAHLKVTQNL
jgi:hypothetical protein